ncbi:fimbrial biogenesis outer membrane usher protein [Pseudomonas tructae]|uniref:Fimbrial biogenesis outer membrane usher protein n=1 Tax=Pseudomonas tructae TaxID=2518644 RepID=A0A411MGH4_9PSED|nr:fimbria/pilus outer membrane usher protein [Pseudomonas tructae]QBF25956.1 fimbrial biogenesis outer membrane usher protein [Pseudomonas tructae]
MLLHASAQAETTSASATQFEPAFLINGSGQAIDLSRFENRNVVAAGTYNVDVFINQAWQGRFDLPFKADDQHNDAQACFDLALMERLAINPQVLSLEIQERLAPQGACLPLAQAITDASSRFEFASQRLYLSVPQASLKRSARDAVDPEHWDSGVTAGFIGYNFNLYGSRQRQQAQNNLTQGYLGLNTGLNLGQWRLRHDGALNWNNRGQRQYQSIASYAQRDITPWTSQLTLGEAYTSGELFDSVSFTGVRLASDHRMLPNSLRGFAPVVRGVASSNARVVIRQRGTLLHETTVAPGAFEIDDLYATGYGGDLEVTVIEADGREHGFSVPYAAVPLSLRPGISRYSATLGTLRNPQLDSDPMFVEGTWQYGLNNLVSTYSGMNLASGYDSALLGAALNTELGAFGADITQARTHLQGQGSVQGQSLRLSYAKTLADTDTQIALATYRYSTSGFFGLEDAHLQRQYQREHADSNGFWRQRNRTTLGLGQPLADTYGQLHLSASAASYWNRSGSDLSYTFSYSNRYKTLGYSLNASRELGPSGRSDNSLHLSLSLPLGGEHSRSLSASASRDNHGRTSGQTTLTGTTGSEHNLSYGVTASHDRSENQRTSNLSTHTLYRSSAAELSGSLSRGSNTSQASIGARGAVVAHPGGVTLSQPLSDTFAVVNAENAQGARVSSGTALKLDSRGYAVVPSLTPYRRNTVSLDPKGISTDVELQINSQHAIPRAGAIPLLEFKTTSGRSAIIHAKRPDGTALPFGASVVDETGTEIGVVGQGSQIFARGLQQNGTLQVHWNSEATSSCLITYTLAEEKRAEGEVRRLSSICKT